MQVKFEWDQEILSDTTINTNCFVFSELEYTCTFHHYVENHKFVNDKC
jgi:hypothetical protein